MDSDDRLLPHGLESLLEAAKGENGVAYGWCLVRGERREDARLHGSPNSAGIPPTPVLANFRRSVITTPGSAIVKRTLHRQVGGFVPGYEPMEDRDFWVKCGMLSSFAFCETVVLDKTWRPMSAGTQIGKRISSALKSQLAFFPWCRERGLDASFLDLTPVDLVNSALKDILWHRRWEALPAIRAEADALNVRGYWYHRANLQHRMLRLVGRRS